MTLRLTANSLSVSLLVLSGIANAQNVPANFIEGEDSIASLIEFPELRGDASVTISCIGLLTTKAKLEIIALYLAAGARPDARPSHHTQL